MTKILGFTQQLRLLFCLWTNLKVVQQNFGVFQRMVLLQAEHLPVKEGKASETVGSASVSQRDLKWTTNHSSNAGPSVWWQMWCKQRTWHTHHRTASCLSSCLAPGPEWLFSLIAYLKTKSCLQWSYMYVHVCLFVSVSKPDVAFICSFHLISSTVSEYMA